MKKLLSILMILGAFSLAYCEELNFDKTLQEAKKQQKSIFIFFHMNGCEYCEDMLANNFKDKQTIEYIKKNFLLIDINISHKDKIVYKNKAISKREFSIKYNTFSYPSSVFIDSKGKNIYSAVGYKNTNELKKILKYIKHEKYKTMKFEDFSSEAEFLDD